MASIRSARQLRMASAQPVPSSTRRNRDASHAEVPIGRYIRLDQIGRGSFATVYQGIHAVRLLGSMV